MLSWLSAMASFAMLLAVQLTHSPLHHCVDCHGVSCQSTSCATEESHEHSHCHSHSACHHHHHSSPVVDESRPGDPNPVDSHEHCDLCQFLAQAIQPISLPVELPLHEQLELLPPAGESIVSVIEIVGPYVRGPPMTV
jgi:hypothetical protein